MKLEDFSIGNVHLGSLMNCLQDVVDESDTDRGFFWLEDTDLSVETRSLGKGDRLALVYLNGETEIFQIETTKRDIDLDLQKIRGLTQI